MQTIKTGIIGFGRLGRKHAEDMLYRMPEVELRAVCSVVDRELEQAAQMGVPRQYKDYLDMLNDHEIEAVVIVSPSTLHLEQTLDCMDANLHIFCEKPLALSVEDCQLIERAAAGLEARGKCFMLGFMRRFDASYAKLKRMLDNGELGSPIVYKGNSLDPMSGIQEYLAFARNSGGPFLDMAIHDIDLAVWYLGEDIESVYACGNAFVTPEVQEFGDADNAFCMLRFHSGAVAMLHAGRTAPNGYQVDAELTCTHQTVRVNPVPAADRLVALRDGEVHTACEQRFFERFDQAYLAEKQKFFDCVRHGLPSPIKAGAGTLCTRVALAATQSMHTGKIITL